MKDGSQSKGGREEQVEGRSEGLRVRISSLRSRRVKGSRGKMKETDFLWLL